MTTICIAHICTDVGSGMTNILGATSNKACDSSSISRHQLLTVLLAEWVGKDVHLPHLSCNVGRLDHVKILCSLNFRYWLWHYGKSLDFLSQGPSTKGSL